MADVSVRAAAPSDAEAVARVQHAAWRDAYTDLLPEDVLAAVASPEAAERWRQAVTAPPSPRHRVLVALAGPEVVGFTAFGPAEDPDLDAAVDAELHALCVRPDRTREGHGSRLINAAVDHLRDDGFLRAHTWLGSADDVLRGFLVGSGWDADGAHRSLDLRGDGDVVVPQVRLHTGIGEQP
jgi:GNAT superfamily N-acetyltransferase